MLSATSGAGSSGWGLRSFRGRLLGNVLRITSHNELINIQRYINIYIYLSFHLPTLAKNAPLTIVDFISTINHQCCEETLHSPYHHLGCLRSGAAESSKSLWSTNVAEGGGGGVYFNY